MYTSVSEWLVENRCPARYSASRSSNVIVSQLKTTATVPIREHRLLACHHVDDGEAPHLQRNVRTFPIAASVRAAMTQALRHQCHAVRLCGPVKPAMSHIVDLSPKRKNTAA
jgi:hypothetical protein